jgi:hypothetical protein
MAITPEFETKSSAPPVKIKSAAAFQVAAKSA